MAVRAHLAEGPVGDRRLANLARPPLDGTTVSTIPGIRLNSKFYVDNLGYKYYRRKLLVNSINLICEQRKNPRGPIMCHGSASISRNDMDNQLSIVTPHNHRPEAIDLNVPFLRNALGEKAVDRTTTTPSIRSLYNSEIIKYMFNIIDSVRTILKNKIRNKRLPSPVSMSHSHHPPTPHEERRFSSLHQLRYVFNRQTHPLRMPEL
ncbi:hypothetical protein ACI65C_006602 [Semiaphis heraclei]